MNPEEAKPKTEPAILARLSALLGEDAFFVPCEWETKKPLVTYVDRPFEATRSEAYRAVFGVQEVRRGDLVAFGIKSCCRRLNIWTKRAPDEPLKS